MSETPTIVEKRFQLAADHANRLSRLAQKHQLSEDQIIEKALDMLLSLTDLLETSDERQDWSALSEASLQRIWDNEEDAAYDDWRTLYGVSTR